MNHVSLSKLEYSVGKKIKALTIHKGTYIELYSSSPINYHSPGMNISIRWESEAELGISKQHEAENE